MIHSLVPMAVLRKSETIPPDTIIGNTEMAACIGLIYKDAGISEIPRFETPEALFDDFQEKIKGIDKSLLSDASVTMMEMVSQYHVLPLKNETIEDLGIILSITMKG